MKRNKFPITLSKEVTGMLDAMELRRRGGPNEPRVGRSVVVRELVVKEHERFERAQRRRAG